MVLLNILRPLTLTFFFFVAIASADVLSTQGQIKFDINTDNQQEMTLNGTGLGIGISPSVNLHIAGNAIISDRLNIGSSSGAANLNLHGTLGFNFQTLSSNTTIDEYSTIFADSSNGNIILTLPYAGNVLGRQYLIKKISPLNDVHVLGQFIDNSYGLTLLSGSMQYARLMSSGNQTWNLLATSGNGGLWTPAEVTTSAWYDAADASSLDLVNGNVMQWDDKSGNDNHLVQNTATLQPRLNGQRIDFVNGDKLIKSAGVNLLTASGNHSIFFVHDVFDPATSTTTFPNIIQNLSTASPSPNNRRPIFFYVKTSSTLVHSYNSNGGATINVGSYLGKRLISGAQNNGTTNISFDGLSVATFAIANRTDTTHSSLNIGDISNQNLTISFYELIFIAGGIDTATNQKVEGYLAWKWGLENQLNASHPYKHRPPLN